MADIKADHGAVVAGGNMSNNVINTGRDGTVNVQYQIAEIVDALKQLRDTVRDSEVADKDKAVRHIETALDEAEAEAAGKEADKEHAGKSLEKAVAIIKGSGEVVDATVGLGDKIQPVLMRIAPWLAALGLSLGL